jgi:V8-like Glu-specific endopeptidase
MANSKSGTMEPPQKIASRGESDDDILSGASAPRAASTTSTGGGYRGAAATQSPMSSSGLTGNEFVSAEVEGEASVAASPIEVGGEELNQEFGNGTGTEIGEEFAEATESQLASAEAGEETAVSDLRGIEGFEGRESGAEGSPAVSPALREAGEAVEGTQEEFFPILAALAPTLISAIGPSVAKGVMGLLSPRAKRVIASRAARPVISAVAGAVSGAAGAAAGRAAARGKSSNSDLLQMIAKLLQQVQAKPGGESGIESEEAQQVAQEAAAALEVIIGTDDRVRISQTTAVPWRRICALRITFPSGATYRGTGFLIGPRAVATAGHCVYLHNQGGWARRIQVIPGANGSATPYGQSESTTFRSVGGWVTGRKPEYDYGCVVLSAGAFGGQTLGQFGFAAFDPPALLAQSAVLAGFPGDKPFAELWGMARRIKTVTARTLVYDIDSMGGQSGAPVYIKRNGQRYVVGIHNYGAAEGNSATRVTQSVYQRLQAWSKL